MIYTDVQIKQADAALQLLHERNGFVDGHELYQVMGHPKAEYMRAVLCDILHLITRKGNSYMITEEGEKAYEMGFKSWIEERNRKNSEDQKTLPWYVPDKRGLVQSIIASVVSAIVGAFVSWLLMR